MTAQLSDQNDLPAVVVGVVVVVVGVNGGARVEEAAGAIERGAQESEEHSEQVDGAPEVCQPTEKGGGTLGVVPEVSSVESQRARQGKPRLVSVEKGGGDQPSSWEPVQEAAAAAAAAEMAGKL